jgi:hypothetical protein
VDYRAMAAQQPHRASLPERFRFDERAGTVLGALLLTGQLVPHKRDGQLSARACALYEAGIRYAGVVARYRAMIGTPRMSSGLGKGYPCSGELACGLDPQGKRFAPCECKDRADDYNDAFGALAGHQVQVVVHRVVVHGEEVPYWQVPIVRLGLGVLARHFELRK